MGKIHTLSDLESGPNSKPLPNPWSNNNNNNSNMSRPRSHSSEPLRQQQYEQQQGGMQYIGCDGYKKVLPAQEARDKPMNVYWAMCCPCCVGNPCGHERRAEWVELCKSFMFIISVIQIIMFIVELGLGGVTSTADNPMLGPPTSAMIDTGAKDTYLIRYKYHVFRFITPIFLHAGFIHIVFNLWAQLRFGLSLEREWGVLPTMIIYFVSGIAANIFSSLIQPDSISVGASGAILGIMGAYFATLIWNTTNMDPKQRKMAIIQNVLFLVILMVFSAAPHIDWSAHLGGAIFGFFTASAVFGRNSPYEGVKKVVPFVGLAVVIGFYILGLALFFTIIKVRE